MNNNRDRRTFLSLSASHICLVLNLEYAHAATLMFVEANLSQIHGKPIYLKELEAYAYF